MASVVHELPGHPSRRLDRRAAVIAPPAPPDLAAEEARLAKRAVAGDGDAFAELYGRYEKRAYNLCLRILGSEDDAADATQ
jgi:DNA-directed RNA polymerase specialized sigma24 family protein